MQGFFDILAVAVVMAQEVAKLVLPGCAMCTEDVKLRVCVSCTVDVSTALACKSDLTRNLQSWALRKSVYVTLLVVGYKAIFACPTASATRPAIVCSCDSSQWVANWLILPEVICLSQRLSHACVSSHWLTVKLRTAHYNSTNLLGCTNSKRITAAIRELILAKSVVRRVFPFLKSITSSVFWGVEGT